MRAAALVAVCVVAIAGRARAVQYEIFVQVSVEEDLYDLRVSEQISDATFEALLLLFQTKVDLNRADRERLFTLPNLSLDTVDRILQVRDEVGRIEAVEQLVERGAIDATVAQSLLAFIVVERAEDAPLRRLHGFIRVQTRWSGRHDRLPPPVALQGRVRAIEHLDAGIVGVLSRNDIRGVRWDRTRQALSAEPERTGLLVPKAYLEWKDDRVEAVVGTYRIGFGSGLTFDVTDQPRPNGFFGDYELRRSNDLVLGCRRSAGELPATPCPSGPVVRVTPDFRWTNRLAGAAFGVRGLGSHRGWFELYGWGSYQFHRVPQYEVARGTCADPRLDDDPTCRAPPVFVRGDPLHGPAASYRSVSLPRVVTEGLAGVHAAYAYDERTRIGLTGYASVPRWRIGGVALTYQETSRRPFGGPFGAVGVDAAYGFRRQDFAAELARSFDAQPGGGGWGAIVSSVTNLGHTELRVSGRYYDRRYANPYARPISAPDELDGLRARDEVGVRVQSTSAFGRIGVRTVGDLWRRLSTSATRGSLFVRFDVEGRGWRYASWIDARLAGEPTLTWASRLARAGPMVDVAVQGQLRASVQDAAPVSWSAAALAQMIARPAAPLRVRVRTRYDVQEIGHRARGLEAWWSTLEVGVVSKPASIRIRYDCRVFLDDRESTQARVPNPEHWLWLEIMLGW